ncbi:hypothetical protein CKA55_06300 [Arcobacter suis]|uniref:Plasmid replication protein RepL domain-containing protein n=1 Tax=Arcobacter suis CECT 7833 TaxID=663365 RepID=A0AAD0SQE5_9BACT|nr:hypothetical protein [Arcobacter suis]AXX89512.1 hypothetical protein ASUIS_1024 [Arcobacter suis CECT 7833]RWS46614.1 hypothetical protein CKA55_06300 [Arcobacter suis]
MNLTDIQKSTIKRVIEFNSNKETNYLYLKHSLIDYIFKLDITSSSKLFLIYLIKNISLDFRHLFIITPYEKVVKDLKISKPTIVKSIKELNSKEIIKLHSGTNKEENTKIKEFIFEREQFKLYTPNQHNIIDLTIFFKNFLNQSKEN